MIKSRPSLCVTTALAGGVLTVGLLGSTAASAECNPFGGPAASISSVVSSIATLQAQGSSPFVVATPTQAPDQLGGGVWARGIGGSVRDTAPITGPTFVGGKASLELTTDCRVRQGFAGAQVGADVANLNLGGSGGTLHVGLTSGFLEGSATIDNISGSPPQASDFQLPFFGPYATLTYGDFFADAQIRGNFFEISGNGNHFNATGFAASGNAGYHYNLPDNWFIEPSIGVNWSRTFVDPFSTPTPYAFRIHDFDSILGRASLRGGTTLVYGQYIIQPYVTASVFHEFASPIGIDFASADEIGFLSISRILTYGQFGLGVAGQIANSGWTSFVRGDYMTGSRFEGWDVTGGARYDFNPETGPVIQGRSADLAEAPYAPAPYNWSGFFVGASAPGALWGESKWNFGRVADSAANNYAGVLAGGGGGFNYQMGALVLGGAAEWDWTNARGGESFDCPANGVSFNTCANRVNSIFTATARVGYAYDRLLVYGQGGLAVGDVVAQTTFNSIPGNPTISDSKTSVGWTLGAGFEFGLTKNISAKAEYLYFDLGSDTYNLAVPVAINRTGNIGRVGLNYRFDLM
jgi:outer membrane autotransporter protein